VSTHTHTHTPTPSLSTLSSCRSRSSFEADFSASRLFVLLSVWTANPVEWHKEGFNVPQPIIDLLKAITTDEHTTVYLLSGRGISDLEGVSAAVPKLGVV